MIIYGLLHIGNWDTELNDVKKLAESKLGKHEAKIIVRFNFYLQKKMIKNAGMSDTVIPKHFNFDGIWQNF